MTLASPPTNDMGSFMTEAQRDLVDGTLNEYPLCEQIVEFLLANQNAMDTVRGVANCWVGCDEAAAQVALERLSMCGVVITHRLRSGTLYAFTPNQAIRDSLRETISARGHGSIAPPASNLEGRHATGGEGCCVSG